MVSLCLIRSVHSVFRPIEIFKIWREGVFIYFDRSRMIFDRSKLVNQLFKKRSDLDFFKVTFQIVLFFSLSPHWLLAPPFSFCHFLSSFFARFLSLEVGKSLLPFFFKFISCFHALSWVFSASSNFLGFLMIQAYSCVIDQWVFVPWCYIDVPYSLIWSILWFLKNWKF